MKVVDMPLSEIREYDRNPRLITEEAVEAVARSMQTFGVRQAVVLDKDHVICMGHVTFRAAQRLEMETLPVHVADNLGDEEIRALRIIDNRILEYSQWDFERLETELEELKEVDLAATVPEVAEAVEIEEWFPADAFTDELEWEAGLEDEAADEAEEEAEPVKPKKREAGLNAVIGPYRFKITKEELGSLLASLAADYGEDSEQIANGLLHRLGVNEEP